MVSHKYFPWLFPAIPFKDKPNHSFPPFKVFTSARLLVRGNDFNSCKCYYFRSFRLWPWLFKTPWRLVVFPFEKSRAIWDSICASSIVQMTDAINAQKAATIIEHQVKNFDQYPVAYEFVLIYPAIPPDSCECPPAPTYKIAEQLTRVIREETDLTALYFSI